MTAIAYKDGILAADSGAWRGNVSVGFSKKLHHLPPNPHHIEGAYIGICGLLSAGQRWLELFKHGDPLIGEDIRDVSAIVIDPSGNYRIFDKGGFFMPDAPFYALGSACDFLQGSMAAGASAIEAVSYAIAYCSHVSGPIQSLKPGKQEDVPAFINRVSPISPRKSPPWAGSVKDAVPYSGIDVPRRCIEPPAPSPRKALCDCERAHNGIGIVGRECDCQPTPSSEPPAPSLAIQPPGYKYCMQCGRAEEQKLHCGHHECPCRPARESQ